MRLTTLSLVIAAAMLGFALAWWLFRAPVPGASTANLPSPAAPPPETATDRPPDSPVVELLLTGSRQRHALAVVAGRPDLVIAASADIAGASQAQVRSASGQPVAVVRVAASDDRYGLALLELASPLARVRAPAVDESGGSLRSGRRLVALDLSSSAPAEISGPAQRNSLGAYYYPLREYSAGVHPIALVDADSERLAGVGMPGLLVDPNDTSFMTERGGTFQVIDSEPVAQLLAAAQRGNPMTLAEFSRHYYDNTLTGRLARLQQLVNDGDAAAATRLGSEILNLDLYLQERVPPLLVQAFEQQVQQMIEQQQYGRAVAELQQAYLLLGLVRPLVLLESRARLAQGQPMEALAALLQLQNPPRDRVRSIVLEQALVERITDPGLLQQAIGADPEFAPYHRLLGEYYAGIGDTARAIASLQRAAELDRSMSAELEPAIARLRARRETPAIASIPIVRQGGTFVVDARINGSQRSYRLVLDTGASYTAISTTVALELGLNRIFLGAPVVELQTANGRIYTTTALLDSVDVAGARVRDVQAVILESSGGWDGLLGQSFLQHFNIDIDRSAGVIHLYRRGD